MIPHHHHILKQLEVLHRVEHVEKLSTWCLARVQQQKDHNKGHTLTYLSHQGSCEEHGIQNDLVLGHLRHFLQRGQHLWQQPGHRYKLEFHPVWRHHRGEPQTWSETNLHQARREAGQVQRERELHGRRERERRQRVALSLFWEGKKETSYRVLIYTNLVE